MHHNKCTNEHNGFICVDNRSMREGGINIFPIRIQYSQVLRFQILVWHLDLGSPLQVSDTFQLQYSLWGIFLAGGLGMFSKVGELLVPVH